MTTTDITVGSWFCRTPEDTLGAFGVDVQAGLSAAEVERRRAQYGPNTLPSEPPASYARLLVDQLRNPMNLMLIGVTVAGLFVDQLGMSIFLSLLVLFNVTKGASQAQKARQSVEALAELQAPAARARRDGALVQLDAVELVPGDIVLVEAGDLVPADGRLITSASLEVQESALTGESVPIAKDPGTLDDPDTSLGDRTNLAFQNTLVTRGTATLVVTATGTSTEMGKIAGLVSSVERPKSPLERELDSITKILGIVAWTAVAIIIAVGLARGLPGETVLLVGITTGIASIPTGMPTFVQTMLSDGAQRLAASNAVVKTLTDVETLGGTTAINSDKTGTLTLNQMTATALYVGGYWHTIEGNGYEKTGAILRVAGGDVPSFERLGLGLALCSDAVVSDTGEVIGDPTEAALVVLAAKVGVDAEETRLAYERLAEVPFDSAYKYMATFHRSPGTQIGPLVGLVKGAPDVVLARCTSMWTADGIVALDDARREEVVAANRRLSERGLRVLSFAIRELGEDDCDALAADPMARVEDLVFVALVGIIDPLRPEAIDAVRTALHAGIDVRMITGDHTVTARAIADQLGLGPGVMSGSEFRQVDDAELNERLPELHVFGRVAPDDKLRLAALMQDRGDVVAMTGDAVNDAAALKQADIGVAMGSGSEVTKQAAKIVLLDDDFSTLVTAIELGRDVYRRVSSYVRLQLTVLTSVLTLMLLATVFDVNNGIAMTPLMLLFAKMGVVFPFVIGLLKDVADPETMNRPPRSPDARLVNGPQLVRWLVFGLLISVPALMVLTWGPDEPRPEGGTISMTMTFGIVGLAAGFMGLSKRRALQPAWAAPMVPFVYWSLIGIGIVWLAIEWRPMQRILDTVPLTGSQWLLVIGLALLAPLASELDKAVRRSRQRTNRTVVSS